jgi:DNA-binding transcriptional LysR family regulator
MNRVTPDAARTTLFQLKALVSAITHGNYADAADHLGVRDKHQLIKAVERLSENLDIAAIANRIGDDLVVPSELHDLELSASQVLGAIDEFQRTIATLKFRTIVVRCLTYPSMVTLFLADAIANFERGVPEQLVSREVRFVNLESTNRRQAGAAMLRPLMSREVDVAIAPTRALPRDATTIGTRVLYRWEIVAAIHKAHPLLTRLKTVDGRECVDIADVARFPLLLSPTGHRSRDLLAEHEPVSGFNIELESLNSRARAALGRSGIRVPLIASDALTDGEFESHWPALVARAVDETHTFLSDTHSIYWRTDLPGEVSAAVLDFVNDADRAATLLRDRRGGSLPR